MKKLLFLLLVTCTIFGLNQVLLVNAASEPVPDLSAMVYYPDTCNPEFWATFEVTNFGATASSDSFLSVTLSQNLELVSWHTKPDTPEMRIRTYEKGDSIVDVLGSTVKTNNTVIELYNHEYQTNETITVTIFFENALYQSPHEWIKCRLVMYPKGTDLTTTIQTPAQSIRKDPQGYPVYQFPVAPNEEVYPIHSNMEVIPEFPSGIVFPVLLAATVVIVLVKNKFRN